MSQYTKQKKNCEPGYKVKVHVYGQISGQKYKFPAFTGKITHAHAVCTRPFLLLLKGPGYEATSSPDAGNAGDEAKAVRTRYGAA